jgi:hypothetical protein
MAAEVQISLTETTLIQQPEIEIRIIPIHELLQLYNLQETIVTIQQELTRIHNQQEVIAVNLLQRARSLQAPIPDHLHTAVEVMEVEDHHRAVEEDNKN